MWFHGTLIGLFDEIWYDLLWPTTSDIDVFGSAEHPQSGNSAGNNSSTVGYFILIPSISMMNIAVCQDHDTLVSINMTCKWSSRVWSIPVSLLDFYSTTDHFKRILSQGSSHRNRSPYHRGNHRIMGKAMKNSIEQPAMIIYPPFVEHSNGTCLICGWWFLQL